MRNTIAVFKNQYNEFKADREQLLLFVLFPAIAFFQARVMDLEEGTYPYQIVLGFAGLFTTAILIMQLPPIIAEHRENGSLRFMVMAGIKPVSYLTGIGSFFLIVSLLASAFLGWIAEFSGTVFLNFLLTMGLGFVCSILVGGIIGILCENRQKASSIALPVGMGLIFLPMFAQVVEPIQPVLDLLFISAIPNMLEAVWYGNFMVDLWIALGNIVVLALAFVGLFKFKGLKA